MQHWTFGAKIFWRQARF